MDPILEISPVADGRSMRLIGELDLSTAPLLSGALGTRPIESEVMLDLSELTFIDSAGLKVLLAFAGSRNGNGPLVLLNPPAPIERVFEITGVGQHPHVEVRYSSRERPRDWGPPSSSHLVSGNGPTGRNNDEP